MNVLVRDQYFLSANGIHRIHCRSWQGDAGAWRPRAVLQILHGMSEHIGRYAAFAEAMVRQGFVVSGTDHLGHGLSVANDAEFSDVGPGDASAHIVQDVHQLRQLNERAWPDLPQLFLGHSMGSLLLRRYLMDYGEGIDGAVIMGTGHFGSLELAGGQLLQQLLTTLYDARHISPLLERLTTGGYNKRIRPQRTDSDWLSRDPAAVDRFLADPLAGHAFRLNAYGMLFSTIRYIQREANLARIPRHLPLLFVAGEQDPVGDYGRGVREVWTRYRAAGLRRMTLKLYPGARHELLNELDPLPAQVQRDILAWWDGQLLAGAETTLDMPRGAR